MYDMTNPEVARQVFKDVQTMRIPFTAVNSTLRDMVNIYATPHISPQTRKEILQHLAAIRLPHEDLNSTFFYVFGISSYALFLQMIAKEDSFSNGTRIYTPSVEVVYSDLAGANVDECPIFTEADANYWNIEQSRYALNLPKSNMHIVKVVTKEVAMGRKPRTTTDYCMFIPGGNIVPKVTRAIKSEKNFALNCL